MKARAALRERVGVRSLLKTSPKRANFSSIQQSSGISAIGYGPTPLRTGYEEVLAHRTDDLFAQAATQDGKVTQITDRLIEVTYKNGETKTMELGRRFGVAAGVVTPHEVVTKWKVGDKLAKGDIIAYNSLFFTPNRFNPSQVLLKAGVMAQVALTDNMDTLEDSSAISEAFAAKMATRTTKVRTLRLAFDQQVHELVKEGAVVEAESILCTIEEPVGHTGKLFDETSLQTLSQLTKQAPRAKKKGVVERIEVFYHGDVEAMTESLKEITLKSDRARKAYAKDASTTYTSGRVDGNMRFEKDPLTPNTLVIRVYITGLASMGVGDKLVVGNQLKSIVSRVYPPDSTTASGIPIDLNFAFTSVDARIVQGATIAGTTNRVLMEIGKAAARLYFSLKKAA